MYASTRSALSTIGIDYLAWQSKSGHPRLALVSPDSPLILRGDQHLRLRNVAGWTVKAAAGTVWITQDGDPRDIVLDAGQSFVIDRAGEVLLSPIGETEIRVMPEVMRRKAAASVCVPILARVAA